LLLASHVRVKHWTDSSSSGSSGSCLESVLALDLESAHQERGASYGLAAEIATSVSVSDSGSLLHQPKVNSFRLQCGTDRLKFPNVHRSSCPLANAWGHKPCNMQPQQRSLQSATVLSVRPPKQESDHSGRPRQRGIPDMVTEVALPCICQRAAAVNPRPIEDAGTAGPVFTSQSGRPLWTLPSQSASGKLF